VVIAADDDTGLASALDTLRGLLTAGETLEAWAAQRRIYALTHRRICIAASSGRFIALTRRMIGGYESADIRWQDLREVRISAGILAADLTVVAQSSSDLASGEQHDQVWREKRRVRELEELSAKSGRMQFSGVVPNPVVDTGAESEPARRLRQAKEMLEAKLITDSEFESIKAKIVSGL
jgi:hypothetical protein